MARKRKRAKQGEKAAYVVFHGRKIGVFSTRDECDAQVKDFPYGNHEGYNTRRETDADSFNNPGRQLQEIQSYNLQGKGRDDTKPSFKMHSAVVDLTLSDDDENYEQRSAKAARHSAPTDANIEQHYNAPKPEPIVLTPDQQTVVDMALTGHNIFLTGAAGSGKTVTLKAILRAFKTRKRKYQVVAPTGIAALPLGGKTTFSFFGWRPDSLSRPIKDLRSDIKSYVKEAAESLKVLIIEEISMVEIQMLERMDLVMQSARGSSRPFGGLQVMFLGDFHQLPPVKPFKYCLHCGKFMSEPPLFRCEDCDVGDNYEEFIDEDKWAFKATVWSELRLKMVQLRQIHRQKDSRFQDILNKIRYGKKLSDDEWTALESKKTLGYGIRAVRLMSLRRHVDEVNTRELAAIMSPPRTWESLDWFHMINRDHIGATLPWDKDNPLEHHRFTGQLKLKIGAKVILLTNLKPGLVNGSQGVVIDFKAPDLATIKENAKLRRRTADESFHFREFLLKNRKPEDRALLEPVVRFANGTIEFIPAITSTSRYGTNQAPYLAARTQIPLALGWALSIHKSQGMTLDYVEVSSKKIFSSGQLYVALSRATSIEGLTVTGTSREQLGVDENVVEFYKSTKWEHLSQPRSNYLKPRNGNVTAVLKAVYSPEGA